MVHFPRCLSNGIKSIVSLNKVKPPLNVKQQKVANTSTPSFEVLKELTPPKKGFMSFINRVVTGFHNFLAAFAFEGISHKCDNSINNIKRLQAIGADSKILKHESGQISALHLTTESFTQKVKQSGGQSVTLKVAGKDIAAIEFPKAQGIKFAAALEELQISELGRCFIQQGNKIYFVSEEDAKAIGKQKFTVESQKPYQLTNQGTVVLCPGIFGRLGNKTISQEAVSFLLRGQSVMMFDYRTAGQSKGELTEKGIDEDLEVIYSYLKSLHIPDESMMFKGTCFGGGPATRLATKHPVNLFLDQTYAEAKALAQEMMHGILPVALQKSFFEKYGFNYNIGADLQKVKGHIAIATNLQDKKVASWHAEAQFESLATSSAAKSFSQILLTDIEHAEGWFRKGKNAKNEGRVQVDAFLHNLKATQAWEQKTAQAALDKAVRTAGVHFNAR